MWSQKGSHTTIQALVIILNSWATDLLFTSLGNQKNFGIFWSDWIGWLIIIFYAPVLVFLARFCWTYLGNAFTLCCRHEYVARFDVECRTIKCINHFVLLFYLYLIIGISERGVMASLVALFLGWRLTSLGLLCWNVVTGLYDDIKKLNHACELASMPKLKITRGLVLYVL